MENEKCKLCDAVCVVLHTILIASSIDTEIERRNGTGSGTGESGKLRWPTDRPRGETRRWTRWTQGGEETVRTVQPHRLVRTGGRGRGEMRRNARLAHAPKPSGGWQTVRGGGSVDHLPLVGRHVGSSSFLFFILFSLLSFSSSSSFPRARVKVDCCTSCIRTRFCLLHPYVRAIEFLMFLPWKITKLCNLRF